MTPHPIETAAREAFGPEPEPIEARRGVDRLWLGILWVMASIGVAMLTWALTSAAEAHSWYPAVCCSDRDCRQEASTAVIEGPNGYRIVSTGEVIAYTDRRVRVSPDGKWHACWSLAQFDKGRILCLFAPFGGS